MHRTTWSAMTTFDEPLTSNVSEIVPSAFVLTAVMR